MKKVLALAACLAILVSSSSAFAQDFSIKNFKVYGEGSIIGLYDNNSFLGGNYSTVYNQYLLGIMFNIHENIQAAVALGYEPRWGDSLLDGKSTQVYQDQVRVVEANLTLNKLFDIDALSAKAGRQFYGDEDSTVMYLGVRHYNAEPSFNLGLTFNKISSIDALAVYYNKENFKLNGIYGIVSDMGGSDVTLKGADARFLNIGKMLNVQAYIYEVSNMDSISPVMTSSNYGIIGVKPSINSGAFKASFEYAINYGAENAGGEYTSNLIKIDASVTIDKLTPRAMFMVAGGLDENTGFNKTFFNFGNYTPGLIFGQQWGYGTDEQIINVGLDYQMEKVMFAFDYFNLNNRDGDINIGNEFDLVAKYAYTENAEIFAGYGFLLADDWMDEQDSTKVQVGVTYKIK